MLHGRVRRAFNLEAEGGWAFREIHRVVEMRVGGEEKPNERFLFIRDENLISLFIYFL
jgi:hypothetical protein